ncbi:hypothetical protein [Neobacillus niacini]|uniref:hypothetical protein n=1 Tax=Neobacillus niacini TaxID=86668 RepID=UPI003983BB01
MTYFFRTLAISIIPFFLYACSPNQTKQQPDPTKYQQLSTQSNEQAEEKTSENPSTEEPSNVEEYGDIEQNNNVQEVPQNEEKQKYQGMNGQQDSIIASPEGSTKLPFHNFKERWNSVTDEQMSNLYIKKLEEVEANGETIYRTRINDQISLSITTLKNYVQSLEMRSEGKSQDNIYNMLTGWSQMITIILPSMEIHDVDSLFNRIGVGPNADLTNMKSTSFSYLDLQYDLSITDKDFTFKISYVNQ